MTGCVFIYLNNICDLKCDYIDMLMYVQECGMSLVLVCSGFHTT